MKDHCLNKYQNILKLSYQNFRKGFSGFRKGSSAQQCLLAMLEKWESAVDNKRNFGALLTELSKAFDCLHHGLLLAK